MDCNRWCVAPLAGTYCSTDFCKYGSDDDGDGGGDGGGDCGGGNGGGEGRGDVECAGHNLMMIICFDETCQ